MEKKFQTKVYAVKHNNEIVRSKSRSGGIFTALSDKILLNDGVVYGCILSENFEAIHIRATTVEERDRMRGSKYIQSNKGDIYLRVLNDLKDGRRVLFSGTSCEVAGLKAFLGQEYSNLQCVDIVCHGVPSPLVWKKYLEWQEQRTGKKCVKVNFRNKKDFGWRAHIETFTMNNGKKIHSEIFKILFYEHWILRPSCYKCPFKDVVHPGDITIADYWGIEKAASEFDDNKGVSLVLINSEKGKAIFEKIKEDIVYKETRIEDSIQPPLVSPFPKPDDREIFWEDFQKNSFEYVAEKYAKTSWKRKLKNFLLWIKIKIF